MFHMNIKPELETSIVAKKVSKFIYIIDYCKNTVSKVVIVFIAIFNTILKKNYFFS